jgi:hypothetical protein
MTMENAVKVVLFIGLLVCSFVWGRVYESKYQEKNFSNQFLRVEPGSAAHDQAAPPLDDKNRPDWITGNVALGMVVTDGHHVSKVSVGDFSALMVDHDTGAVIAKCVQ